MAWDHPRMCGEHLRRSTGIVRTLGSSPHVRGTRSGEAPHESPNGIIPACAGNTRITSAMTSKTRDHPRMCGEHKGATSFDCCALGSSPHVRGTPRLYRRVRCVRGIIPACAGNTYWMPLIWRASRDHPRMCGEHTVPVLFACVRKGSSPHVRGTRDHCTCAGYPTGIIPACAGNTSNASSRALTSGDHPRMCGEHLACRVLSRVPTGSSPHVRGTPTIQLSNFFGSGIIPACAGNTGMDVIDHDSNTDHPRMCGEH